MHQISELSYNSYSSRTLLPLDEMIQTATNTFYNREQEKEAKAQERERRKETRHAQILAALQGSPMAHPESLNDKARGKSLICRQAGHWARVS